MLAGLEARRDRVQRAAENAATELLRDDSLRQGHAAAIAAGEQAWTTLTTRLRARLVDTIDRAELLPVWFDTVLGITPPPEADAWLQAGTELLAYRTTYGVSDSSGLRGAGQVMTEGGINDRADDAAVEAEVRAVREEYADEEAEAAEIEAAENAAALDVPLSLRSSSVSTPSDQTARESSRR